MSVFWRKKLGFLITLAMLCSGLVPSVYAASAPNIFTYQGRVLNANGVPVSDASLSMSFALYTAVTGGTCVWSNSSASCASVTARSVTLTTGLFTENLGDTSNSYAAIGDSIFGDNAALYLEVIIAGETLTPRRQITAAPYALNADTVDGIDSTGFLASDGDTGTGVYDFTGATYSGGSPLVFEGATANDFETTFLITNPTEDRTITFQNASGTVAFTSDISGTGLWEDGTNGVYENDKAVVIGSDTAFTYASGGVGDLQVVDELEVMGDGFIDDDLVVGASTSNTETIANVGFALGGDDLFVAGTLGVEGAVYTDGGFLAGTDTTFNSGSITTTGTTDLALTIAGGDLTFAQDTIIGDGVDVLSINSSDWDISTTGDLNGIGAITMDGNFDVNLSAGGTLTVDVASTTADVLMLTSSVAATNDGIDALVINHTLTDSHASAGLNILVVNADDATAVDTVYGIFLSVDDNSTSADDTAYGLYIINPDQGVSTDADLGLDAFVYLNQADDGVSVADGIFIDAAAGGVTDALDVSDEQITNALNAGENFILYNAARVFGSAAGVITWEDTSGNDLMTLTANSNIGDAVFTGDLTVQGDNIDSAGAPLVLNATAADEVRIGTGTPGVATGTGDLFVTGDLEVDTGLDLTTTATSGTGFAYNADSVTSGIGLDLTTVGLTSGQGILVRVDESLDGSSGAAIKIDYETATPTAEKVFEIESDCSAESTCASTSNNSTVFSIDSTGYIRTEAGLFGSGNVDLTFNPDAAAPITLGADVFASGTFFGLSYTTAETLTGDLTGSSLDLQTNVTSANGVDVMGSQVYLPAFTQTSTDITTYEGFWVRQSGALVQNTAEGQINWKGFNVDMPDITETTGTITSSGLTVGMGPITTGGTQYGISISPDTAAAGTLIGLNIGSITAGGGTENAIKIGTGWDKDIILQNGEFFDNSANNVVSIKQGDGTVFLTAGPTGFSINLDDTTTFTERVCHSGGDGGTGVVDVGDCQAAGQADYAEMYAVDTGVTYGDIVAAGSVQVTTMQGDSVAKLEKSQEAYQSNVIGVVVDNYEDPTSVGYNINEADHPMPVALSGRVLVNVTDENGSIQVGDPITTSSTAGYGMKSTQVGMIIGHALSALPSGTGQIMVFVNTSWYAGNVLQSDGSSTLATSTVVVAPMETASASLPTFDSFGLALRGSVWNGSEAEAVQMILQNVVDDQDHYRLSIRNTSEAEVAYITNEGTMRIAGDMVMGGRLYPSDRGTPQTDKYIYYDGSAGAGGDFMRTNAKGWSTGSYDFAEMFPSGETLTSGDLVVFSGSGESVQRATGTDGEQLAGIVSTRPGFLAGENAKGAYPIALAGRVPTKVNRENGAIAVGDPLTASSTPGEAMKMTQAGQVVGYALEAYAGTESDNLILTYVNVGYWSGGPQTITIVENRASEAPTSGTQNYTALNMSGNIFMATNSILSIGRLEGVGALWSIESDGTIKTEGSLKTVTTSYQGTKVETVAVTSPESVITLTGTATLVDGRAEVRFEDVVPEFNDVISAIAPIRVIVTPSGPVSLYVSEKDQNHFIVERWVGSADVEFDWMVTGYRKGYEPEEGLEGTEGLEGLQDLGEGETSDPLVTSDLSDSSTPSEDELEVEEGLEGVEGVEDLEEELEEPASPESPDEPLIDSATPAEGDVPVEPAVIVIEPSSTQP